MMKLYPTNCAAFHSALLCLFEFIFHISDAHNDNLVKDSAFSFLAPQVKMSLDAAAYQKFSQLTCTYDKNKDYNQLVAALWQVMMEGGRNLKHLFRGERSKLKVIVMAMCVLNCAVLYIDTNIAEVTLVP
jgi:hypothetical protein